MVHDVLIGLHAASGVACFAAGILALAQDRPGSWRYPTYLGGLVALVVFMVGAIAVDWSGLDPGGRGVYLGLAALGLFMLWRGGHAGRRLHGRRTGWRPRYLDDIGFTLISLFDGFAIVAAIDLGAPVWLIVAIAVLGVLAGVWGMSRVKARLT
jgi:hypothetical protein